MDFPTKMRIFANYWIFKMKSRTLIAFLLSAALVMAYGCNKDDESTDYEYFSGSLELPFPAYVNPGYTASYDVDTLTSLMRSDSTTVAIGYYFTDTYYEEKDTVRLKDGTVVKSEYTYVVPDELGTYSISCVGFADYHYTSTGSQSFTIVREGLNGNASLTNFDIAQTDNVFTDDRDGRQYYYTTVGGTDWMRQNLAWEGSGVAYEDALAISPIFGRFYTQEEALEACPEGWRLPEDKDWVNFAVSLGKTAAEGEMIDGIAGSMMEYVYFNGEVMWEFWPKVKVDNSARFSALPVGYAMLFDDEFTFLEYGKYAMFWSADTAGDKAAFRYLYEDKTALYYGLADGSCYAMPVRCVR